jgi:K+-sensing histidine kinase KdpD
MRRRPLDGVDEAEDVRHGQPSDAGGKRVAAAHGVVHGREETIERAILTEEEQFFLAAKVVIEVGGGEVGGDGDVAHAGAGEAAFAKNARGGTQDLEAAAVGPPPDAGAASWIEGRIRTAVRKLNHGSIVTFADRDVKPRPIMAEAVLQPLGSRSRFPYLAAVVIIAAIVGVLRLLPAISAGSSAPLLLLAVLIIARAWGTGPALIASASAALGFSYYFLPPYGFGIENPNDWVTFVAFTATAVVVGELAARAERRHLEAQEGRREIERLYQELQAAFDRASEAEAARRNEELKATLLDALTHNLRTPLTAIKAAVTALLGANLWQATSTLSSEGRRELLQVIDEESDRLNRFIEGLSTAGPNDSTQPPRTAPIDLDQIVRAGLSRVEALTRDHHVVVILEPDVPPVAVDASAITEVLYILLDNASKYASPGTTIRVSAERSADHHVRIAVTDEGPGIPPDYRERVFENFFRIPTREPVSGRRAGAGLGLPIARRLVATQTGRMWVETPPSGRGTTIAFTLPIAAAPAVTPQAALVSE